MWADEHGLPPIDCCQNIKLPTPFTRKNTWNCMFQFDMNMNILLVKWDLNGLVQFVFALNRWGILRLARGRAVVYPGGQSNISVPWGKW